MKVKEDEALLRTVLERLPVGVWIVDRQGKLIHANPAAQTIWTGVKYVGIDQYGEYKGWWADTGMRIKPEEWAAARAVMKGESSFEEEVEIECFDGTHKTILSSAVPIRNDQDEITGAVIVNQDITERNEIQRRIGATVAILDLFAKKQARKEYLEAIVDLLCDWSCCRCTGIRILDKNKNISYEAYTGFSQEFWESENQLSIERDQCVCTRVVTERPDPQDLPVMTPAGSFRCNDTSDFFAKLKKEEKARYRSACLRNAFLSLAVIPIRYRERVLGTIHLADEKEGLVPMKTVDFIESMAPLIGEAIHRFTLEEELKDSEQRLRQLSSELLLAQENERRRIAREVHDSLGQLLSAIKFRVEGILLRVEKSGNKGTAELFKPLLPLIQESIEETRRIQSDLRPPILDDIGILATLSWFTREFQETYPAIRVEKKIGIQESEVPPILKTVLYRITQEAMNNIGKHSGATLVTLSVQRTRDGVELVIQDNGRGFDLEEELFQERSRKGLGLTSMRERAQLSRGSFEIESNRGKGTTLRAIWHL
jgi:signal transduction histidine kinase